MKTQAFFFSISLGHKPTFETFNGAINVVLDFVNPFIAMGFLPWGRYCSVQVLLDSKTWISGSMPSRQWACSTAWAKEVSSAWCERAERNATCLSEKLVYEMWWERSWPVPIEGWEVEEIVDEVGGKVGATIVLKVRGANDDAFGTWIGKFWMCVGHYTSISGRCVKWCHGLGVDTKNVTSPFYTLSKSKKLHEVPSSHDERSSF